MKAPKFLIGALFLTTFVGIAFLSCLCILIAKSTPLAQTNFNYYVAGLATCLSVVVFITILFMFKSGGKYEK